MAFRCSKAADTALAEAATMVIEALDLSEHRPIVRTFFDPATFTGTHVVHDGATLGAAIIDSVLDFDAASGQTMSLLETHGHADHLSAAPYLQERLGGRLSVGGAITTVQVTFGKLFNEGTAFERDGSQFDRLFEDGDSFQIGKLHAVMLHRPGHTPADLAYVTA